MLRNEAETYDSFPGALQGCDPSSPSIVPKFYGYYLLSLESLARYRAHAVDDETALTVLRDALRFLLCLSPMLLLEFCGEPIRPKSLSTSGWCEDLSFPFNRYPKGGKIKLQAIADVSKHCCEQEHNQWHV